jgi:hypothetical protein
VAEALKSVDLPADRSDVNFENVIVVYPRGLRTGGPEALHQLVDSLRRQGREARLYPLPGTRVQPRVVEFDHYDAPETDSLADAEGTAIVIPEVWAGGLEKVVNATWCPWWLSIDNAPFFHADWMARDVWRSTDPAAPRENVALDVETFRTYSHLAQSHYAWAYLNTQLGLTPSMLTDWTDADRFDGGLPAGDRRPVVAYNAAKGGVVAELVHELLPEVRFVPLHGMSPHQIADTLSKAAVYLDLGHHPGRDRLPREAALAGATVVVARRGSAAYAVDVPLPAADRLQADIQLPQRAALRIREILTDLPAASAAQEDFRMLIRGERARFDDEVRKFFVVGECGDDGSFAQTWASPVVASASR